MDGEVELLIAEIQPQSQSAWQSFREHFDRKQDLKVSPWGFYGIEPLFHEDACASCR